MKVLITDDVHSSLISGLQSIGCEVSYLPFISLEEVYSLISEYQGLIVNSKIKVDKVFIEKAIQIQVVARLGSGKEILDLESLQQHGIKVITTPEANCNAVAEHALGMLLSLLRNIPKSDQEVKNRLWRREENRGYEISNLCFGILGYGHTGSRFCELLSGFGCKIIVYDPFKELHFTHVNWKVANNLNELRECDVISLHVNLLNSNKHLVDSEFIELMKRPFYLVNTSRGMVVDTLALVNGLISKKIIGACIDVFENENVSSFSDEEKNLYQKLYKAPNTILSPHIAGWTFGSKLNIAQSILNQWPKI
ncbi:MAG: NAD(P)-dependent oxidoreductase [Saprospiraceae bacterium]